jgi:catechol 2,3-dioxygenase-like lactoylglutathione lyase family enzyme
MTVTDLDAAVRWYGDVVGLEPIGAAVEVRADEGHGGTVAADVFGRRFGRFRQAHLATANGVALELFEFVEPPAWTKGLFHVCLASRPIDELAARIATSGSGRSSRASRIAPATARTRSAT